MSPAGSLIIVGTGIQLMGQTTLESQSAIRSASKLLYLVTDPVTKAWLTELNPSAEDLWSFYKEGKYRQKTYNEIVERIMYFVRIGESVCAAFYGHPGVFVQPSHEAIKLCRAEGYSAIMLPGVSADACLFADLGIDPGSTGCQSFEATDFLLRAKRFDENVTLILWQISVIGIATHKSKNSQLGLKVLSEKLAQKYGADHEVIVYEAARYPVCPFIAHRTSLALLHDAPITGISTLVVPPKAKSQVDEEIIKALNLPALTDM